MKQTDLENIVLSLIIPTLNRRLLLENTLELIISQLKYSLVEYELIVSDNASDDDTFSLFLEGGRFNNKVQYKRFEQRVEIDESFARSVNLASGRFILLFGDDDIPLPGFINEITATLSLNLDVGFLYVNRIIGDLNLNKTTEVPHSDSPYGIKCMTLSDFIREFTHWPGFVTCLIFSKESWEKGIGESKGFDGYNFLSRIYNGSVNKEVCYIASPLVLQRRGIQSWKKYWPSYWLVNMPKLLVNLEDKGITYGALERWQNEEVTTKRFLIDCFVAKAYNYSIFSDFWKISRNYQKSLLRLFISYFFQFCIPVNLAKAIYSKTKKMT